MDKTSWRDRLLEWRHIAYRAKVKYFYETEVHSWLRRKLWPLATKKDGVADLYRHAEPVFDGFSFEDIGDPFARESIEENSRKWSIHPDVIYEYAGDILIEPRWSLGMIARRHFIEQTRGGAHKIMTPPFSAKWRGRAATKLPSLIHFDGFLGTNLFHFFSDALNPFLMMRDSGVFDMDQPVLINHQVYRQPYVQKLLHLPCFDDVTWKVQERGEFVTTRRMIKGEASFAQFNASYAVLAKMVEKKPHRRIFLDRRPKVQRRLINMSDIAPILAQHGFETIFAEDLPYLEQAQLFAEASHVVGLHGAGLTNLLFCDLSRTRVLEITSKGLMNPHFYWMTKVIGIEYYDVLSGSDFDINWNYSINPERFGERIKHLLAVV